MLLCYYTLWSDTEEEESSHGQKKWYGSSISEISNNTLIGQVVQLDNWSARCIVNNLISRVVQVKH